MSYEGWPVVLSACADCGIGTVTLGEYYMVRNDIWEQAWAGRRKWWYRHVPGQEILCIACLEARIGRELTVDDFTAVFPRRWPPPSRLLARRPP
jgi:hypothetical protein